MNGSGSDVLGQQQQQQEEDDLRLKVGAIVAYECLLDDTIGTTSWRIGAVRALATPAVCTSPSDGFNPTSEPVKGNSNTAEEEGEGSGALAASEKPMTPSPPSPPIPRTHLTSSLSSITLTRKTTCQTAEIQPWISLATATPAAYRSHNKDEEGDYNSCSVGPAMTNGESLSPSSVAVGAAGAAGGSPRLLSAGGPSACLAEMNAVQTSLKEEKEKEEGMPLSAHSDAPSGAEDDEDRLAKALSAAYTRVLTATTSRDGERGRSTSSAISEASAAVAADPSLQRQIEAKRAEFRVRIEQTLADLQQTRQQQHDLQKAQEKAQTQLQHARQHLREAQEKVQEIDVRALKEIQGYRLPPAVVQLVMSAVLCVLGEKASTWSEVVTVMRTPSFIARVALYDPAQLTQARLEEVKKKYIAERNFSHAVAMKGSQALGQFQEWVMRQAQLADADGSLARFLAQKESSTAALAVARQKIAAGAAELECLEAELDALLHEQGRQQQQQQQQKEEEEEELRKSTGGVISANGAAVPSPRPPEAGAQQRGTPKEPQASQQQQPTTTTNSSPATPRSRSRQLSPRFAKDKLSFGSPIPTTSAVASSTTQTPPGANNTVGQPQQQLHVSPLPPPGSQWLCPPAGAVHNTYVLRSSILCVLGYTSSDDAVPLAGSVFTLTNKQQQLVCEAMEKPLHARPLVPLTAKEAAAERVRAVLQRLLQRIARHAGRVAHVTPHVQAAQHPLHARHGAVRHLADGGDVVDNGAAQLLRRVLQHHLPVLPFEGHGVVRRDGGRARCFQTVMAHYEGRQQRRSQREAEAAIAAQQRQHMKDLKQQLLDALAAQTSQQNTVQGLELTHTAALQQAQQTQQQHAAEVKEAENAAAEAERQLHAAHAALQEQAKMHQEEVEKLLGQLAQREEALHQLQEAHTSAQAAVRRCETRVKQQQEGDEAQPRELTQRWGQVQVQDTHSKLVEALQAQLHATETASSSSRLEQQRHADAAAAAAVRRNERRAALEDISHKIQILAKRMPVIPSGPSTAKSNEGTAAQPQHVNPAKVALGRELAVQLHAMTKEKADVAAAVAQSRRATTHHQRAVEAAAAEVQRRRRALHEAVGGGTGSMASTASAGNEEEQDGLAALYAEVAAASQRCTASMQNLTVQEEQRLQACAEEEAEVSRILQRMNASGSRDAVAQLMREVHNRATSSFLQRHQTAWMNTCLCGLLFAAVATLQYKKYAV
ncbi:kinetoplast-associated protein-like protein [Leptomonas pyrrhocoris]|uniref:Kinetoplast-associated protein-like protein n=1 Tax=Leptomonas pyrrhocoris TaxID=157538 RepID=A0A0M9FWY6_LEPPY|nr:kinetoplast-associated protein-like protein [Leptomonas pyrrhocoris]XP_015656026.1 kinetoplast-associated protein-like protein [Leptomonas pyrrhocoris]KPA77586.1 kinetoplast-associated protein-like protein [Leptomonas pyrrhocoris]KPA77587.1 kinetoplast-associated protein-like protein [Leptomonas pyrrhocoris]|eukprot:XP_015656025.1 kinetoplast-associated protein-like protein [Leptomonas pyrrhocoris]